MGTLGKKQLSTFKIAAVYIGTVVGAGFATGQEVLQFFTSFGLGGIWGILLSTALFMLFGVIIMELGRSLNATSHLEIVQASGGKLFASAMDILILVFLFASLTAMLAGTGAMFQEQLGLTGLLGNVVMAILTAMTVLTGVGGVLSAISAIVPFLLASVVGISLYTITQTPPDLTAVITNSGNPLLLSWPTAAILYASYNIIMSISVLGPLGAASEKKTVLRGGMLGGLGLGLAALMIDLALSGNVLEARSLEIPMSLLAARISPLVRLLYSLVLIAEIYTTAVGALFGISARLTGFSKKRAPVLVIGVTVPAFFASLPGFSNLVKYLYPLQGYAGIVLLAALAYGYLRARRRTIIAVS